MVSNRNGPSTAWENASPKLRNITRSGGEGNSLHGNRLRFGFVRKRE